MTKKERQENETIAALGCWICRRVGVFSPSEIHHVRRLETSKKRDRAPKIPLCFLHHRGPYGIGIHSGRGEWQDRYGDELKMAEEVRAALEGREQ